MRKGSLQTGQCVFCDIRQTWSSLFRTAPPRGARTVSVRRVLPRRPGRDGDRAASERSVPWSPKTSSQNGGRVDLRTRTRDLRAVNNSHTTGFLRLSSFEKENEHGKDRPRSFRETLINRLDAVQRSMQGWDALSNLELGPDERKETFANFRDYVMKAVTSSRVRQQLRPKIKDGIDGSAKLVRDLERAYELRANEVLDATLKYGYYGHVAASKFSTLDLHNQKNLADLRYPLEWFPKTRSMKRKIHLHVGPTNSGKTYTALKALEAANRGIYAGPLRLLAHEVYTRLNASGRRCQLVTGEERRFPDEDANTDLVSCTVEMVDCNSEMDVAVIDEIQMIGSDQRGWAWTQAFLGVQAKEVHLCGEERTVPLIKSLAAMMGDPLEVHRYERLSPLGMDTHHLNGNLRNLRKGDCIVAFSVLGIHALKRTIEQSTQKKVAIVYGSLPPETRAQQARLFNDPDNDYDYLVASDAVGMGLNLSIKRLIFESSQKNDGGGIRTLKIAEVKQIAGRAGRYRTAHQAVQDTSSTLDASPPEVQPTVEIAEPDKDAEVLTERLTVPRASNESSTEALLSSDYIEGAPSTPGQPLELSMRKSNKQPDLSTSNVGLVTTLYPFDFPIINRAMGLEPEPIKSAGLQPPGSVVERFTSYFPPGTPFSYILLRLNEISQMNPRFHLCGLRDTLLIADAIHSIEALTTADRLIICAAPVSLNRDSSMMKGFLQTLARAIANQRGGSLLDIPPVDLPLERLDLPVGNGRKYLQEMEELHKMIILYLWLSYRFSGVFSTRQLAFYVKELIEKRIDAALSKFNFTEKSRRKIREAREKSLIQEMENAAAAELPGEEQSEGRIEGLAVRADDETAELLDGEPEEGDDITAETDVAGRQPKEDDELVEGVGLDERVASR